MLLWSECIPKFTRGICKPSCIASVLDIFGVPFSSAKQRNAWKFDFASQLKISCFKWWEGMCISLGFSNNSFFSPWAPTELCVRAVVLLTPRMPRQVMQWGKILQFVIISYAWKGKTSRLPLKLSLEHGNRFFPDKKRWRLIYTR